MAMNPNPNKALFLLLLCSIAFPALRAQQSFSRAGKDHALLFAVKDYREWDGLNNPVRDAEAIAQVLEHKYGFAPTIIRNPSGDKIRQTIRQYLSKSFSDDEQLFIYFSGHGKFVPYPSNPEEGKGYFIPYDGKRNDPYQQSYLSWIDLLPDIDNIPCKHIMLVVDACYSGSILKGKFGRPGELSKAEQLFQSVLPYPSRLVITSGGKTERSDDGKYHSPLTEKLLAGFAGNGGDNGVLTFYELFSLLQDIQPRPRNGYFGQHNPNGDFLFLYQPPTKANFVTDSDGNRYPILSLAGKQWLGKNLNLEVPGSYCYDDDPANCREYGRLYTREAAKEACRRMGAGWRLPADEEVEDLYQHFGDGESAYKALIKGGSSGFAALPGGSRGSFGEYNSLGRYGYYWSATRNLGDFAWGYYFNGDDERADRYGDFLKSLALSCRCLRDN
ncbi:MAG: caspase family protein [Lewinellaceae bacterium]|nr:caspase family protein [Phaeodactylibacter sp.]MCB9352115.1 caspase family protein [Lewinellaceae bacterium]